MPSMDGTGPRVAGQGIGAGRGRRNGAGRGFPGCRYTLGLCYLNTPDEKAVLTARKEAMQRTLDSIEKRLQLL